MDPTLVIVVCLITIGVPIRLAWGSLMELLNRTPSLELLAEVRDTVATALSELPVAELNVRMIQAGRTRTVLAHVLLSPASALDFGELDAARVRAEDSLKAAHPDNLRGPPLHPRPSFRGAAAGLALDADDRERPLTA